METEYKRIQPLTEIKSKTAQVLYNTKFQFSVENLEQNCFPTFVMSKITGKPFEVYVRPQYGDESYEEYLIYDSMDLSKSKPIGKRYLYLDPESKLILPGYMRTLKEGIEGIGFRLHQITYERMLMLGYKGIQIISTSAAYPFHLLFGYTGSEKTGDLSLSEAAKHDWELITEKQPILLGKFNSGELTKSTDRNDLK